MTNHQQSNIDPDWDFFARMGLDEDRAAYDATTNLLGRDGTRAGVGKLVAEERFVVAGIPLATAVFDTLGEVEVVDAVEDGMWVDAGTVVADLRGPCNVLLSGERVALNYIQRLCGIATQTRNVVDSVRGHDVSITDTRKTTPGLRALEKYAVRVGGGINHRFSLEDAILWKDNHWSLLDGADGTLRQVLSRNTTGVPVQVEVERVEQLDDVIQAGVTSVLIDNQTPETIAEWAAVLGPDVIIEASGGITPELAPAYARAGVQRISMGSLTHSVKSVEMKFEITPL